MNKGMIAVAAAATVLLASKGNPRNKTNLPSFRGVAEVRSSLPGRLRLYMPAIAGKPECALQMKAQLESTGAIGEVQINPTTCTALFIYDSSAVEAAVVEGAAIKLMGLDDDIRRRPVSSMEKGLKTLWSCLNHGVLEATNGLMDGRMLAGSAMTVAGLKSLATSGLSQPGALTLLWWAAALFRKGNHE